MCARESQRKIFVFTQRPQVFVGPPASLCRPCPDNMSAIEIYGRPQSLYPKCRNFEISYSAISQVVRTTASYSRQYISAIPDGADDRSLRPKITAANPTWVRLQQCLVESYPFFSFQAMPPKDKKAVCRKPTLKQTLVKDLKDKVKAAKVTLRAHEKNLKSLQGSRKTQAQRSKQLVNLLTKANGQT